MSCTILRDLILTLQRLVNTHFWNQLLKLKSGAYSGFVIDLQQFGVNFVEDRFLETKYGLNLFFVCMLNLSKISRENIEYEKEKHLVWQLI